LVKSQVLQIDDKTAFDHHLTALATRNK